MTDPKTPERMPQAVFEDVVDGAGGGLDRKAFADLCAEARRAREAEEVERFEAARWKRMAETWEGLHHKGRKDFDALRAERDALRKTVECIAGFNPKHACMTPDCDCISIAIGIARAALSAPDVYSKPSTVNHPESWLECDDCRALSKSGTEPYRCEVWERMHPPRVDPFDRPGEGEKT
jgi:hypothetical protein